ncbi:MAG: hypothetical protein AAF211_09370, partial [Myxococcota bacterium]
DPGRRRGDPMTPWRIGGLVLLTSCSFHRAHFVVASSQPVSPDVEKGRWVVHEQCRWFLFGAIPLQRMYSPADELRRLTSEQPLLQATIEESVRWALVASAKCLRITGFRAVVPEPDPEPVTAAPAPPPEGQPAPIPAPRPHVVLEADAQTLERQEVAGWPTMPLGSSFELGMDVVDAPSPSEVWVRPSDWGQGFLSIDITDARVLFVDGVAVRTEIEVPTGIREVLTEVWGKPRVGARGSRIWRSAEAVATLEGTQLRIIRP